MSESLSQLDELREQLDALKYLIDSSKQFLNNFFLNIKNEVTTAFAFKLEQTPDESNKIKLNENLTELFARINAFELECSIKHSFSEPASESNEIVKLTEIKLDHFNDDLFAEISDLIYDETYRIEKILFLNKTIVFLDKSKCKQIDLMISDDLSNHSTNVSEDSNESFNEDVNLFYYMNNKTTAGKLIIIKNEYFGKRTLSILK